MRLDTAVVAPKLDDVAAMIRPTDAAALLDA